ncbi:MAG: alpha-amylase family glycosyl hydrolase [Bacteroidales bacterium]|nr:alpha-amylase family glycosyl hydrolase [Bacteroidales bacterium]
MKSKIIIYQVLPRIFGNTNSSCIPNSSYKENGSGKLEDFSVEVLNEIKELGVSHIWFTGVIRHATKTSFEEFGIKANHPHIVKGEAGSPYSITDYYDISPELSVDVNSRLKEFQNLVKRVHSCGLKVLIDFVPNHLSREYKSLQKPSKVRDFGEDDKSDYSFHPMNNFYYIQNQTFISPIANSLSESEKLLSPYTETPAKVTGNNCITATPSKDDWFETIKLNYGVDLFNSNKKHFNPIPNTWIKMREVLFYWLEMGVDGFRCDMVGMVPQEFWQWVIREVKQKFNDSLFIGELYEKEKYNSFLNFCKFDLLYDKVGLYDTLKGVVRRERSATEVSYCWQSLDGIENQMLNFLENHDEVRVASPFFANDPLKAFPALTVSLMLNNAPFMLYFGQELGEEGMNSEGYSGIDGRTSIFDYCSIKSIREWLLGNKDNKIRELYRRVLTIATQEEAIYNGSRYDIQYANGYSHSYNPDRHYSFVRKCSDSLIIVIANFGEPLATISLNMPKEMFNYFNLSNHNSYMAENLLTGEKTTLKLSFKEKISIKIEKEGVAIVKLLL